MPWSHSQPEASAVFPRRFAVWTMRLVACCPREPVTASPLANAALARPPACSAGWNWRRVEEARSYSEPGHVCQPAEVVPSPVSQAGLFSREIATSLLAGSWPPVAAARSSSKPPSVSNPGHLLRLASIAARSLVAHCPTTVCSCHRPRFARPAQLKPGTLGSFGLQENEASRLATKC